MNQESKTPQLSRTPSNTVSNPRNSGAALFMTYSEKLRDPRWQKKRLEIMNRDKFTCQHCQDKTSTLNVHHATYVKGWEPWEYPDHMLITVCEPCHEKIEKAKISLLMCSTECVPMWKLLETLSHPTEGQFWEHFQAWHSATIDADLYEGGVESLQLATFNLVALLMNRYNAAELKDSEL